MALPLIELTTLVISVVHVLRATNNDDVEDDANTSYGQRSSRTLS